MKGTMKKCLSTLLALSVVFTTVAGNGTQVRAEGVDGLTLLTEEQILALTEDVSYDRTSVHDPSVVVDENGDYYIFGSHMGVSKTEDLMNWSVVTGESTTSTLFDASYTEAFAANENTTFDAAAWISDNTVQGNMWAPDVIYNEQMGKWCMYLSLNGAKWNSSVILLTADEIDGPYAYQGPVVVTGFSTTDSTKSFKNTDLELVIGEQEELPEKYQKIADESWGTYWPHAIDPAVFYDEDGNLWMTYGSWSGGIYVLELDEATGLRDYNVTYESDFDEKGASVTTDEYFGKKIAGGYYVSGEGPYIEQIGDYYYLFVSYGFYSPEGGYNMRVFRSETPDGEYVDANGNSAIFTKYIMNYSNTNTKNNIGMKLMGNYKWDTMEKAEVAQGHNSAFVDKDGKIYVVYHTKFNDGTAGHEVRVHQMFVNEEGWLVAAPYEYSGETISASGYENEKVVGNYGLIIHDFQIDYANLAYKSPEEITLLEDGTITGAYEGTWTVTEGTPYVQLTIDGSTFKGVFTEQTIDGSNIPAMCFTAVNQDGLSIWGSGEPTDDAVVAQNAADNSVVVPANTYSDITLPTEGLNGASITWMSDNEAVLASDGTVTIPAEDTTVNLTKRIVKGEYYYDKTYAVTVKATAQNTEDSVVVGSYFTGEEVDLSQHLDGSLFVANPFYCGTNNGLNLSGGVTIEFDAKATGDVHVLGTILSFLGSNGANGRLYFTPGSYLGYNAAGSYFDANLKDYGLVEDYIGEEAHVAINLTATGFSVVVNDEIAYTEEILTTENGAGTTSNYKNVLDWLYNTADTLYFGYGSWWNAATYDEANILLSNVVCTVGPITETEDTEEVTDAVTYTKEEVILATNADITVEENPFYGKNIDNIHMEYTINMTEGAAQNGWDGIFSFFSSTGAGRVSIQTNPYVCFNGTAGWMDINQPGAGGTDFASSMVPGTEYDVVIDITTEGAAITVDGVAAELAINSSGTNYEAILDCITSCDQLTWGVGLAETAFWYTELCTLTDITLSSEANGVETPETPETPVVVGDAIITEDEIVLGTNADLTVMDSPFYNAEFNALSVSYTINFSEEAVRTGWDGLFSFYNSATGGRVSFQSAPYICYNDMAGLWMDLNQPGTTLTDRGIKAGVDYDFDLVVTEEGVQMYINHVAIPVTEVSSGATYSDLLAFIKTCDQFTWGVGTAQTSFWWTEMCTLTDVRINGYTPATTSYENDNYTIDATSTLETVENPFYKKNLERLHMEYTINFAELAAKNGWDGIFSFYNTTTGGRVSVQSAPYICFNDMEGNWLDFNQPGAGGRDIAAEVATGEDVTFAIDISADAIVMTANGEVIETAENSSGATYADLLAYISECDALTLGVGEAVSSFWWSELCTVSNLSMSAVEIETTVEGNGTADKTTAGAKTELTAKANRNSEFVGWYVNDLLIGTEEIMTVEVCEDTVITAKFEELPAVIETTYKTIGGWTDYVMASYTVKNISEETLKSWALEFDYEGEIVSLWGATLDSAENGIVTVSTPKWSKNLKSGASITFYFIAKVEDRANAPVPQNPGIVSKESAALPFEAGITIKTEWCYAYVGELKITNTGEKTIDSWTLEFDYEDNITSLWGAKIVSHEGNHYVIENAGYNSEIAPGQTIVIGFMANPANDAMTSDAVMENTSLSSVVK